MEDKRDLKLEYHSDCVVVTLLSEDAVAWVEENFSPNARLGGSIRLPGDGEETLERMREDGLA